MSTAVLFLFLISIGLWVRRSVLALRTISKVPRVELHSEAQPGRSPSLTLVIPARNEEKNLPGCLQSLLNDPSQVRCLVINDRSTDATEAILLKAGFKEIHPEEQGEIPARAYLNIRTPLPAGWTGKNRALAAAAPYLTTDWILFTDADTEHVRGGPEAAVQHALAHELEFLTLTPRCLTGSWIERLVQPTAMGLMGLWFPLLRVNDPGQPDHFANGQYLLIRRRLYEKIGGHASVSHEFLEDFALMKKAKELRAPAACHMGQAIYGTRMYHHWRELWRGWRRIYRHGFNGSAGLILWRLTGLLTGSVFPAAALIWLIFFAAESTVTKTAFLAGAAWYALVLATAFKTYKMLGAPCRYAPLHPLAALIIAGILLDAVRISLLNLKTRWRG